MRGYPGFLMGAFAGVCLLICAGVEARAPSTSHSAIGHVPTEERVAMGRRTAAAAQPSLSWGWGNPLPSGDQFEAVALGGGVYVAAGTGGALYSSTDAAHWTDRSSSLSAGVNYVDALYANGLFLAAGTDGAHVTHISTSRDGVTWTDHTPKLGAKQIADHLGYGNGTYVAVNSEALTSTDGITWHEHSIEPLSLNPFLSSPVYANGTFAVMGIDSSANTVLFYSADGGVTWKPAATSIPNTQFMTALASNGSGFVITGTDETFSCTSCGVVYTSTDGDTWTLQADAGGSDGFDFPVIWNGKHYLTISSSGGPTGTVYISADGVSWAMGVTGSSATSFPGSHHPIIWNGSGFVGTGINPLGIQTSTNFVDWTDTFTGSSGPAINFGSVAFLNGHYLAVGAALLGAPQVIMESLDGIHWTKAYSGAGGQLNSTGYGNGTYVALGDVGTGFISTDALHWSAMTTPPPDAIISVAYGNGTFVGVGFICAAGLGCTGRVDTSPDGKTWTFRDTSSLSQSVYTGVVYTGNRFVLVTDGSAGDGHYVLTSTDGITWAQGTFTPPAGTQFAQLRWYGDHMAAIGSIVSSSPTLPYVATSTDGLSWTGAAAGASLAGLAFSDLAFDGTQYYAAVGRVFDGTVMVSGDAKNWTSLDGVPLLASIQSLTFQGGRLVTAGWSGDLLAAEAAGPTATAGSISTTTGKAVGGTLTASASMGAVLSFSVATQPMHGSVTISNAGSGGFQYTPEAGYAGSDPFTFQVSDGLATSTATEDVTVNAPSSGGGGAFGLLLLAGLVGAARWRRSTGEQRVRISR